MDFGRIATGFEYVLLFVFGTGVLRVVGVRLGAGGGTYATCEDALVVTGGTEATGGDEDIAGAGAEVGGSTGEGKDSAGANP